MANLNRRAFLQASLGAAVLAASKRAAGQAGTRPNVVLIIGDDLRADALGALGNRVVKTPCFDEIIRKGYVFRRAYCMGSMIPAVCLPSRTMILTGQSLFHAEDHPSGKTPDAFTLPVAMKSSGYSTLHVGKRGASPTEITNEFEESYNPGQADAVADTTVNFIHRKAARSSIFIYMAGMEPHDPQFAPHEFYSMYKPEAIPMPVNFAPYYPLNNGGHTVRDEMTLPYPRTPDSIRKRTARYYASISFWDSQVGRVVAALKKAGQYENTIFIIAGDNGLSLGEHGLLGKQNLYENGGMHVPLIFAGPGIPTGQSEALAYLHDIFPTICDFTRVPVPARVESRSLRPIMLGQTRAVRQFLYTAYGETQRSITDGQFKLIRYPQIDRNELFDLETDPHEMNNLAAKPEQSERVRALTAKLAELMQANDDKFPLVVSELKPAGWNPGMLTASDHWALTMESRLSVGMDGYAIGPGFSK
jgi:arylsulfatase A-like enzyme